MQNMMEQRPRASWTENLVAALLALVVTLGGTLDAWAHQSLELPETFFTPWHAVLYSGFLASSAWMGLMVVRRVRRGQKGLQAVPVGYGLGIAGVVTFAVGGLLDMVWHTLLGIEVGVEPLFSPPHLVLGVGGLLMETSPLRALWADRSPREAGGFGALFPAVLSGAMIAATLGFFFMWASPFLNFFTADEFAEAIAGVLIVNVIYVGTLLFLMRRWQLPFGACTFLLVLDTALLSVIFEFSTAPTLLAPLAGGLVADVLIARLRPSPDRPGTLRAMAGLTSAAMWSTYLLVAWLIGALAWSAPVWSGVIVLAAGSSVALALLMAPPPVPAPAAARPDAPATAREPARTVG